MNVILRAMAIKNLANVLFVEGVGSIFLYQASFKKFEFVFLFEVFGRKYQAWMRYLKIIIFDKFFGAFQF